MDRIPWLSVPPDPQPRQTLVLLGHELKAGLSMLEAEKGNTEGDCCTSLGDKISQIQNEDVAIRKGVRA